MNIELTLQQQQALDTQESGPPRVIYPRTYTTYKGTLSPAHCCPPSVC